MSLNTEEFPGSDLRALELRNALFQRLFAFRGGYGELLSSSLMI